MGAEEHRLLHDPQQQWIKQHLLRDSDNYERKDVKVMAVKATNKGEVHFPPPRKWSPDHPWGRPCLVDECREENAPTA